MFNRRELLIGTASTAAVISLPAIAAPVSPTNAVLESVLKFIGSCSDGLRSYGCSDAPNDYELDVAINTSLITRYPELFPAERHLYGGCPNNLYYDGIERAAFCVRTRNLQSHILLEVIPDLSHSTIDRIADELAHEIKQEQHRMFRAGGYLDGYHGVDVVANKWGPNLNMFSLIPVSVFRFVHLDTWQPMYGFKSRYACIPKEFHLMTVEEDQNLEKLRYGIA